MATERFKQTEARGCSHCVGALISSNVFYSTNATTQRDQGPIDSSMLTKLGGYCTSNMWHECTYIETVIKGVVGVSSTCQRLAVHSSAPKHSIFSISTVLLDGGVSLAEGSALS
jgi:hypothetical protein